MVNSLDLKTSYSALALLLWRGPFSLRTAVTLTLALTLQLAWGTSVAWSQSDIGGRWNLVFILADDLGWSDLACYGSDLHETPRLDQFAAGGVRFTNAYAACPVCSPTRASILTGKYPARFFEMFLL